MKLQQQQQQREAPECKNNNDCAKYKTTCEHHQAPTKCCRVNRQEIKCVCCKGAAARDGCSKSGVVCKAAQGYAGRLGNDTIPFYDLADV
ncbi:unnamed protein product [Orchesella dallaii]|uniref:Uncharacterized protein n=1 Tax=Orchesella dallaii TaxID=48710 RepID=A0ABP1RGG6_9HEXA